MKAWVRQKAAEVNRKGKSKAAWYVHWREPDGSRKARACGAGARGKAEAEKLAANIHAQLLNGTYQGDPTLVLWSAFVKEFRRIGLKGKSKSHVLSVDGTIAVMERHMAPKTLAQINARFIKQFVAKRSQDRGKKPESTISPASVNKDLRNLKLMLTAALDWGQIESVPKMQMLKEPRRLKRYVTAEHFAAMLSVTNRMEQPKLPNCTPSDYWRAFLGFAFCTGWRLNEILSIRRSDVDFETGRVIARWDDSKGKRDEAIHIPEAVIELLRPVWNSFRDQPLSWGPNGRSIYNEFLKLQTMAGIDLPCEEAHVHTKFCHVYDFHDFKRAFATHNAASLSPAQLQRLMKHSDFTTTQGYINYAKVMTEKPDVFVPDVLKKNG